MYYDRRGKDKNHPGKKPLLTKTDPSVGVIEIQVIEIHVFQIHLKYFVVCDLDKSNLYFVIEIQLECILCNWNTFLCKILYVIENNTSASCIQFSLVLSIMFQPAFSVFLFIYRTLSCHSTNAKPRNMLVFF